MKGLLWRLSIIPLALIFVFVGVGKWIFTGEDLSEGNFINKWADKIFPHEEEAI